MEQKQNRILGLFILIIFSLSSQLSFSEGSAGENAKYENTVIIDMPTAGVIPKSTFLVNTTLMQSGGMTAAFTAAPFKNFSIGLSYGGNSIIGTGDPVFQELPGVQLRYRPFDETESVPAFLVGINTQGKGIYLESEDRYETLSPGAYLAVSKSFRWPLGFFFLHGGVNYSLEPKPDNRTVNFYFGFEQTVFSRISLLGEYNANLEDNSAVMSSKGLLNFSLRWAASDDLTLTLSFRDIFNHLNSTDNVVRFLRVEYVSYF